MAAAQKAAIFPKGVKFTSASEGHFYIGGDIYLISKSSTLNLALNERFHFKVDFGWQR